MSQNFRPVRQEWGEPSGLFVNHDVLIGVLADVAARVGTSWSEKEIDDVTEVWIEDGQKFLLYVATDRRFNISSLAESLMENGFKVLRGDLRSLISNMKQLALFWFSSVSSDRSLRFFVD